MTFDASERKALMEELRLVVDAVEESLRARRTSGVEAEVELPLPVLRADRVATVSFRKATSRWGFFVQLGTGDWVPIHDVPTAVRVAAVEALPALVSVLEANMKLQNERIACAIAEGRALLERLEPERADD